MQRNKIKLLGFGAAAGAAVLLATIAGSSGETNATTNPAAPQAAREATPPVAAGLAGKELAEATDLYESYCADCHESNGAAESAKLNLVDATWKHGSSLEEIAKTIREGVPGTKMKPNKDRFSEEQIAALAKYVIRLGGKQEAEPAAMGAECDAAQKMREKDRTLGQSPAPESPAAAAGGGGAPGIAAEEKIVTSATRALPPASELVGLSILPQDVALWGTQARQQFVVLARYADGIERDVTELSQLTSSNPAVAKAEAAGRLLTYGDGQTTIEATFEGRNAQTSARVTASTEQRPVQFTRDVMNVLTRNGCNTSDCHASVVGRGGFKLSLNAINPAADHEQIVKGGGYQVLTDKLKEPIIPRVNLEQPEESLLLRKPTFDLEHEGGKRFSKDSADYATLLAWIRQGAKLDDQQVARDAAIERVEVNPKEIILTTGTRQRLVVTAYRHDGRREDMTEDALLKTNNKEVAKVVGRNVIEGLAVGETDILVRVPGQIASVRVGVIAKPLASFPDVKGNNFIDDYIFTKLKRFHIAPSEAAGDAEFLRRACLDMTGRLPPPAKAREFIGDPDPAKREKLIEVLLNSPEYVDYWTYRFSDLFRVALYAGASYPKFMASYWDWIRRSIAEDRPYEQIATERIAAQGYEGASRHYYIDRPPQDMMAEQLRVFMGRRFDCAQCHDHPTETWTQNQFWGMSAFFGQIAEVGGYGKGIFVDMPGGHGDRGKGGPVLHPRTKQEARPTFLDGGTPADATLRDPRLELAHWMTQNPYFDEAIVNRMWSHFFGRGIVNPVDDFSSVNRPSHPELLDALAKGFREHGSSLKWLIRQIVSSRTYQLTSAPNESNLHDTINYSHAMPRPLDAEVLLDAISDVTQVPEKFNRLRGGQEPEGTRAVQLREADSYPSIFLDVYGRPDRLTVPERDGAPNIRQAMHTLAGKTYTEKLSKAGGRLDKLLQRGASEDEIIDELCLAALTRQPTAEERAALKAMLQQATDRRAGVEDMLWGLLNSQEFSFNH